jgi:hypothetical protein
MQAKRISRRMRKQYADESGERGFMAQVNVPRTGQVKCWDTQGREIPAAGSGQDGEYQIGIQFPEPRFKNNDDGTVTDNLTQLIWLKNADPFHELTWEDSLCRARALGHGSYGLSDQSKPGDWRMPNLREMLSLIDYGTSAPIIPQMHPFENVQNAIYWTSTSLIAAAQMAWMITLGIGPTVFDIKFSLNRAWPVRGRSSLVQRTGQQVCFDAGGNLKASAGSGQDGEIKAGGQPPDQRFTDNGDGTVLDNVTNLVWLKNANPFGFRVWAEALELCNLLCAGKFGLTDKSERGNWRLPNVREIESLVDYNQRGPCLPQGHPFRNLRPSSYWTSTSVTSAPTEAMFIILGVGPSIFDSKEHPFFVWPVRSRFPVNGK